MHNFPRPNTLTVSSARTPVPGNCPECAAPALASYRVMSEGGWWLVVKCGHCLHSVSREPGPLLGAFVPLGAP
jgi:vanillate/4-hydroxybenzoate decarboxylase subunit D